MAADDAFTVELQDTQLLAAIDRAIAALEHPQALMAAIGARLRSNAAQRFDSKTDPTGAPWAPLSPNTMHLHELLGAARAPDAGRQRELRRRLDTRSVGPAKPDAAPYKLRGSLLERTRQLRDSLTYNAGTDFVEIGTARPTKGGRWQIGFLHEFGTRNMPRRGLLTADPHAGTLGADDQADVLNIVSGFLGNAFA